MSSDPTISEIREARIALAKNIETLIQGFEEKFPDVTIESIQATQAMIAGVRHHVVINLNTGL